MNPINFTREELHDLITFSILSLPDLPTPQTCERSYKLTAKIIAASPFSIETKSKLQKEAYRAYVNNAESHIPVPTYSLMLFDPEDPGLMAPKIAV